MIIKTWFPLAIATSDLSPPAAVTADMLEELRPFIAAAASQRRRGFAWTGDVNGCNDLHERAAFAWLRAHVEREALAYVVALGCDASRLQLYFQGSWPVLSSSSEAVASHVHWTASLSAVYYLKVPADSGGALVFENVGSPNGLGPGFGEPQTALTRAANPLNVREACYEPQEGRLLLFPARQPHGVRAHGTGELRVAITFDIALAARDAVADQGLLRPEASWDAFRDQPA